MIALIADAHIGGPGGSAGPLIDQLKALPAQGCLHRQVALFDEGGEAWVEDRPGGGARFVVRMPSGGDR